MIAKIKSFSPVDSTKTSKVSYCASNRNVPVTIIGITSAELIKDNTLLSYVHGRISSILNAIELDSKEEITALTLELA